MAQARRSGAAASASGRHTDSMQRSMRCPSYLGMNTESIESLPEGSSTPQHNTDAVGSRAVHAYREPRAVPPLSHNADSIKQGLREYVGDRERRGGD
ncbi:hypothetical protein S40285_10514 [Stachybotrys chlorohalonatus IBT 40285]|uniref:Uncharacterized protein n=1 Tax=Stachybotrys chlorohalonatus (strain IBT 40285) TaxID=1283841 RepID=A0A084QCZ7_STAC4|nr:hypothetical protein S40285_10514 [Stachybotrys chlorohalonata IBT 40285]